MKQHTETLISYVMECSGNSRSEATEWLDKWITKVDMEN